MLRSNNAENKIAIGARTYGASWTQDQIVLPGFQVAQPITRVGQVLSSPARTGSHFEISERKPALLVKEHSLDQDVPSWHDGGSIYIYTVTTRERQLACTNQYKRIYLYTATDPRTTYLSVFWAQQYPANPGSQAGQVGPKIRQALRLPHRFDNNNID